MDKIMLRENGPELNPDLVPRLQSFIDAGFLDIGVWTSTFNQRNLAEFCSKPDQLGKFSWIGFPDVDEFMIMFDKCAPYLHPGPAALTAFQALSSAVES